MKSSLAKAVFALTLIILFNFAAGDTPRPLVEGDVWVGTTIYIRPDGTVDPPDAPIVTYDYETYIVVSNIQIIEGHGIVIERDNVILDGGGYTLRGPGPFTGASVGVYLYGRTNVTIRYLTIAEFGEGIYVTKSSEIVIYNNTIFNVLVGIDLIRTNTTLIINNEVLGTNFIGIHVYYSFNSFVVKNTIENATTYGIEVVGSNNVRIIWNTIKYINNTGVAVDKSSGIMVRSNTITNIGYLGIEVVYSTGIFIDSNYFENTETGVRLFYTWGNSIINNTVVNSIKYGIDMQESQNNYVANNNIHNISGTGICMNNSWRNSVSYNNITNIAQVGIHIKAYIEGLYGYWCLVTQNNLFENTIESSHIGIYLNHVCYDRIQGNTIKNNQIGVALNITWGIAFLHNNFINNTNQVYLGDGVFWNYWNDEFVGNYWSDHDCVDEDGNGVCDNPYIISYPYPYNVDWKPSKYPYPFEVVLVPVHTLITFVRASSGDVWYGLISEDRSVDWRPLGGIVADAPSATFYKNKIYIVARSEDGALWYGVLNPLNWTFSGWRPIPGLAASKPSIVATDYGLVIGVRDISNGIWVGLLTEEGVVWYNVPGLTVDTPALAYVNGTLHIVVRGLDGYTIWHSIVELPSFEFKGWKQVYGFTNSAPELLAVGNTIILAVRDLGNGVALATYSKPVGWLGWMFIPGGLTDTQPNLEYFNDELLVIVKAYGDQTIWLARKDHYGFWYWTNLPGLTTHEPDILGVSFTYYYVVPKT